MDDLKNMHNRWSIIADPNEYGLGIRVVLPDKDIVWPYIFEGLPFRTYPQVVSLMSEEIGYGYNGVGIDFPEGLLGADPNEPPIPADAVEVYIPGFEDSVLPRALFYEVLEEFAQQLVEQPGHPIAWYDSMQAALAKLRAKMAADAAG